MHYSPTAKALFDALSDKLQLNWCAGSQASQHVLRFGHHDDEVEATAAMPLVGYLNFVRPNQIQVLGDEELAFLARLGKNSFHDSLAQLFSNTPFSIIVADDQTVPAAMIEEANRNGTPLLTSPLGAAGLVDYLGHYLASRGAQRSILHGVFMEVMGIGVLLSGPSGVGKSELALELITRGHRLIADDAPEFCSISPDTLRGNCPKPLRDFLEVRGLGLLNIRAMFGDNALKHEEVLRVIVRLKRMTDQEMVHLDRLQGNRKSCSVLGVAVTELTLPVIMGSNLAVLVEGAVRNHLLLMKGHDATATFVKQQRRYMAQDNQ